ncbi:hypothetical protein [Algibacter lectus]|uniref:hypothetical protein n=1 Tax=Algibacter lectus TaxID=221126 RepID=UPI00249518ED|nr:hypothetical protein [Algibacter lectus]
MDKIDKEVFYWSIWKLINYVYSISIVMAIAVGVWTLLYVIGGMQDDNTSQEGLIKVWGFIISYIIFRNVIKSFFKKRTNDSLDEDY